MTLDWRSFSEALAPTLAAEGFDLLAPFPVDAFNARAEPCERLPDHGLAGALGLVVAHSRWLWTVLCQEPALLRDEPNPLDRHTERAVPQAVEAVLRDAGAALPFTVLFGHRLEPRPLPIQRIAEAAGLTVTSPSHLSLHPRLGPWLGLRAVVTLGLPGPERAAPRLDSPCDACTKPCLNALSRALATPALSEESAREASARPSLTLGNWRAWLAVRDACPEGRAARYSEAQLAYHYTKDRSLLPR